MIYGVEQKRGVRLDSLQGGLQRAELPFTPSAIDYNLGRFGYGRQDSLRVCAQDHPNLGRKRAILDGYIERGFLAETGQRFWKRQGLRASRCQDNWNDFFAFAHPEAGAE